MTEARLRGAGVSVSPERPRHRMANRAVFLGIAASVVGTLALSGCSSDAKPSDKIKTGDEGKLSSSAAASPHAEPRNGRPTIKAAAGITEDFTGWSSTDPAKNTIILDARDAVRATNSAIVNGQNPDDPAVGFFDTGPALQGAKKYIADYKKRGATIVGTVRYGKPSVSVHGPSAFVSYCSDETKGSDKDLKTGKLTPASKDGSSLFVHYSVSLVKNGKGVWQTGTTKSEAGSCRL